jgi:hypothetical protein
MKDKQLSLRQKLDALAAQGKEIKVTWEGGNDSGGYNLFIDNVEVNDNVLFDEIVDPISNTIDYGTWAGDYFADGSVVYNSDEGSFMGEGKDTESEGGTLDGITIEIRVPKSLNFDSVEINTEGTYCLGELNTTCRFGIANGPVFPEHTEVEDALRDHVRDTISTIIDTDLACKDEEVGWVYNDWSIKRESFKEDGDDLVAIIDEMDFTYNNTRYQSHHISINEEQ